MCPPSRLAGGKRRTFLAGGLTYRDFCKRVETSPTRDGKLLASAEAYDPVGRMLVPGDIYRSEDLFYVDLLESDPFTALERYAQTAALASGARPNLYNFPTVCMWYIGELYKNMSLNSSVGGVEELQKIKESGFLRYSPVAIRLTPDKYNGDTEQGWWDDEHWRKFGHLRKPYETMETWCRAIRDLGGLPFIYMQTGMPSDDFAWCSLSCFQGESCTTSKNRCN